MPVKDFLYIKTIADEKSIRKAADKLYIAQPSLSKYVQRIEHNLGYQIFIRTANGVALTQVGKLYYEMATNILDIYREFSFQLNKIKNAEEGNLKIGASWYVQLFFLAELIAQFSCDYPNVGIELIEKSSGELLEQLKHDVSMDIVFAHRGIPEHIALPEHIICQKVSQESFCIVSSKELNLSQYAEPRNGFFYPLLDLKYITNQSLVRFQPYQKIRQITDQILRRAGINPPTKILVHGFQNALEIVSRRRSIVFLPERYLKKEVTGPYDLEIFSVDSKLQPWWILEAYYCNQFNQSVVLKEFIDLLIKGLPK